MRGHLGGLFIAALGCGCTPPGGAAATATPSSTAPAAATAVASSSATGVPVEPSGTPITSDIPRVRASRLIAGAMHNCLRRKGIVHCWGYNIDGQLGNVRETGVAEAKPVMTHVSAEVAQVAAGGNNTCAVLVDGTVRCWGANSFGLLGGTPDDDKHYQPVEVAGVSGATSVVVGHSGHACAIVAEGKVLCWGKRGSETGEPAEVPGLSNVAHLAAGDRFTCAARDTGPVSCWKGAEQPVAVTTGSEPLTNIYALAAGNNHACALTAAGKVFCWPRFGEAATPVTGLEAVVALSAGDAHTCAVREGGTLACWGENTMSQLGDRTTETREAPVTVDGLSEIVEVAAGGAHTCALTASGQVWCWGLNEGYQLGNENVDTQPEPTQVPF